MPVQSHTTHKKVYCVITSSNHQGARCLRRRPITGRLRCCPITGRRVPKASSNYWAPTASSNHGALNVYDVIQSRCTKCLRNSSAPSVFRRQILMWWTIPREFWGNLFLDSYIFFHLSSPRAPIGWNLQPCKRRTAVSFPSITRLKPLRKSSRL